MDRKETLRLARFAMSFENEGVSGKVIWALNIYLYYLIYYKLNLTIILFSKNMVIDFVLNVAKVNYERDREKKSFCYNWIS